MTHRPAEGERFRPDAFAERVGAEVTLNIGDNRETGLLVAAKVADDGSHVRLTFELREGSEIAHWINVGYDPGVFGVGGYPPPVVPADVAREYGAGNSGPGWPIRPDPPPDGPTGLQLDLLSVIARITQAHREPDMAHVLLDRLVTCDVPRLRGYLTPETIAWANNTEPDWEH